VKESLSICRDVAKGAELFVGHVAAVILGTVFVIVGTGMGVSLVLLPVGIPVGLLGLALVFWGLFGWTTANAAADGPRAESVDAKPAQAKTKRTPARLMN
jgi:hypothetical protein